jgi:hypothetical protein
MATSDEAWAYPDSLDRYQNRIAGRHPFQLIAGLREQLGAGKPRSLVLRNSL